MSTTEPGATDRAALADEVGRTFLFEALEPERRAWLAERGDVVVVPAGARLYVEGDRAEHFYVLLSGRVRMVRRTRQGQSTINETDHVGAYMGAVRAYVGGTDGTGDGSADRYANGVEAVSDARLFALPAEVFAEAVRTWFPMAVHLLDGIFLGVRGAEQKQAREERVAALGELAATLAHELNNPAAAGVRAAGQLRQKVAGMRHKLALLAEGRLDPDLLPRLVDVQERAVEHAAKAPALGPLEASDAEDELDDWFHAHGVHAASPELASDLVAAGLDVAWLEEVRDVVGGDCLTPAVNWLGYTLQSEALMGEVEEATRRISELVGSVRDYTRMDTAEFGDVDVAVGVRATAALLRTKADARTSVVVDLPDDLPPVPAYAADLNQVWTNLVDNALDALAERGGTVRVTAEAEPEHVVVHVADDGPGVPEQVRETLFEQFASTKEHGTGLGLALVRERVVRQGGSVGVDTGSDGTTFTVRLARHAPQEPDAASGADHDEEDQHG